MGWNGNRQWWRRWRLGYFMWKQSVSEEIDAGWDEDQALEGDIKYQGSCERGLDLTTTRTATQHRAATRPWTPQTTMVMIIIKRGHEKRKDEAEATATVVKKECSLHQGLDWMKQEVKPAPLPNKTKDDT